MDALKIKYFLEIHFSQMLMLTCFFVDLINNQMFTSKWNVYHKLLISKEVAKAK